MPAWYRAATSARSIVALVLLGLGVLVPATRRIAGIGLIALPVAVFPANVQMALHPELYRDIGTETAFLIRLPLQLVLIAWVWWAAVVKARPAS
jgi:uncharacterized membrane protein